MSPSEGTPASSPPLLAIVGPTASGKSRFALEVARRFDGEVVSCDSMAVYRGMDIGTDKPGPEERASIPHHCLDLAEPGSFFSAGAFRASAMAAMDDIASRGRLCILVGGTGLYYRALTQGLVDLPPRQEELRRRFKAFVERKGLQALHGILTRVDPGSAARIGPADALRIVRALEVRLVTGRPLSQWIGDSPFRREGIWGMLRVGITAPRELLYRRIETRVDAMMRAGFLEEVAALLGAGKLVGPARKAIGYGELAEHIEGRCPLDEAVARTKLRSRHLAKRQLTWFKREPEIRWYNIMEEAWPNDAIQFIQRWRQET